MSRPGYWKTSTGEIPYANMGESHVRHALRYCRTKIKDSPSNARYWENKVVELGNEAQRRAIIPNSDISLEALYVIIDDWQTQWDASKPRQTNTRTGVSPSRPYPSFTNAENAISTVAAGAPVKLKGYISRHVSVEHEIARITGMPVRETVMTEDSHTERRLDLDL